MLWNLPAGLLLEPASWLAAVRMDRVKKSDCQKSKVTGLSSNIVQ